MIDDPHVARAIDAALRLLNREIWIITAADGPRRGGLVATWVSPASIDVHSPVLLAAIAPNHFTAELVQASRAFAAHLLREDQIELAWNFCRDSGRARDKLAHLTTETRATGSPVITDCLAWFDCRVLARYAAGDRMFFWADVVEAGERDTHDRRSVLAAEPLREKAFFQALTDEQRQALMGARQADAAALRDSHEEWRRMMPW
jgi:flavin reductase (DIM6/NTAB) family NADH-FMN oxidoreductase RutF